MVSPFPPNSIVQEERLSLRTDNVSAGAFQSRRLTELGVKIEDVSSQVNVKNCKFADYNYFIDQYNYECKKYLIDHL